MANKCAIEDVLSGIADGDDVLGMSNEGLDAL